MCNCGFITVCMCMMSPKCHIVYCIVLPRIVQSNTTVANKLLPYRNLMGWRLGTCLIIVFLAAVVQLFHLTPYAVARSIASKQVGDDEQGRSECPIDTILLGQLNFQGSNEYPIVGIFPLTNSRNRITI